MIASHIHDALSQVTKLRALILEKRCFRGYSGRARILAGFAALAGAALLDSPLVPRDPLAHLAGWGLVLLAGLVVNYSALAYWIISNPQVRRNLRLAGPALHAVPPLAVGAALSLAAIAAGQLDLLFGIWMCLFGLANASYRQALPRGIYWLGIGYIACGAACLLTPCPLLNPWPMGLVFFAGEVAGGTILLRNGANDHERECE